MTSLPRFCRTSTGPVMQFYQPTKDGESSHVLQFRYINEGDNMEMLFDQCTRLQDAIDALVREKVAEQRRADALQEAVDAYRAALAAGRGKA